MENISIMAEGSMVEGYASNDFSDSEISAPSILGQERGLG
jgi:hypothetical protein